MKNKFTLLSLSLFSVGTLLAQRPSNVQTSTLKDNTISFVENTNAKTEVNTKIGGSILWQSDFSDSTIWTKNNIGAQGSWRFGNYPTNFSNYIGTYASSGLTQPLAYFDGIQYLLAGSVGIQNSAIESATIDMSASSVITVTFNQVYRRFNHDAVYIEVSIDNGATWTLQEQVNLDAVSNGATLKNTVTVDFLVGAGVTQGKVRLRWESLTADNQYGSGYGWAIDNFKVLEGYGSNLKLVEAFTTYGTSGLNASKIPVDQVAGSTPIEFGGRIKNTGYQTQPTSMTVTTTSYNGTSTAADIAAFVTDTFDISGASAYTIPTTPGVYNFNVAVHSDSTLNAVSDDSAVLPFEVSNTIFACDAYTNSASINGTFSQWSSPSGDPGIGNLFEITANKPLGAIQIGIGTVSSSSQATYIGRLVKGVLYKFNTGTDDFDYIDETTEHEIVAADFGNIVKCTFSNLPTLQAGGLYLAVAVTYDASPVPIAFSGFNIAGNTMGVNGSSFVTLASDGNTVKAPVVRLDFTDYTGLNEITLASDVNVAPNPFSDVTTINFNLKSNTEVSVVVTDIAGRVVYTTTANQMATGQQAITIDGSAFQAGVYNYTLKVGNEVITKRVVKK